MFHDYATNLIAFLIAAVFAIAVVQLFRGLYR